MTARINQTSEKIITYTQSIQSQQVTASDRWILLTEVDKHLSISLAHERRHCKNTGHIVVEKGLFLLNKDKI